MIYRKQYCNRKYGSEPRFKVLVQEKQNWFLTSSFNILSPTQNFRILDCSLNHDSNNQSNESQLKEILPQLHVSLGDNIKNQYFMTRHIPESSVMFYP